MRAILRNTMVIPALALVCFGLQVESAWAVDPVPRPTLREKMQARKEARKLVRELVSAEKSRNANMKKGVSETKGPSGLTKTQEIAAKIQAKTLNQTVLHNEGAPPKVTAKQKALSDALNKETLRNHKQIERLNREQIQLKNKSEGPVNTQPPKSMGHRAVEKSKDAGRAIKKIFKR